MVILIRDYIETKYYGELGSCGTEILFGGKI